jgi:hypothetical protein
MTKPAATMTGKFADQMPRASSTSSLMMPGSLGRSLRSRSKTRLDPLTG